MGAECRGRMRPNEGPRGRSGAARGEAGRTMSMRHPLRLAAVLSLLAYASGAFALLSRQRNTLV